MRARRIALPATLVAVVACATSNPPVGTASDGASFVGTVASAGSADASAEAASGADAGGAPASAADAGTVHDAGADPAPEPPLPPAVCPATITLGDGTTQTFSTPGDDQGLSVTPDELTAAWTTDSGSILRWVDRSTPAIAFGVPRTLAGSFGERVALTSDGLGLAVVNPDGLGFSFYARATRNDAFTTSTAGPFASLADMGTTELAPAGEHFAAPLFARGDWFFLYSRVSGTGSVTYVSTRFLTTQPFAGGAPYVASALGIPGQRRFVTGASPDLRALFVRDDDAKKSRLISLTAANEPVSDVELGGMGDLQASGDCTGFWYTSGSPLDVVRAPAY